METVKVNGASHEVPEPVAEAIDEMLDTLEEHGALSKRNLEIATSTNTASSRGEIFEFRKFLHGLLKQAPLDEFDKGWNEAVVAIGGTLAEYERTRNGDAQAGAKFECQSCDKLHDQLVNAIKCCPPRTVFTCGRDDCGLRQRHPDQTEATECAKGEWP